MLLFQTDAMAFVHDDDDDDAEVAAAVDGVNDGCDEGGIFFGFIAG